MDGEEAGEPALSEEFACRRAAARARLDALDPHKTTDGVKADPMRREWFEAVYALAEGDPAGVPWANLAPHPLLDDWLSRYGPLTRLRALDVGCGLGDNALALANAGARVTAFDLVKGAIRWARSRFPRDVSIFAPPIFSRRRPNGVVASISCMNAIRSRLCQESGTAARGAGARRLRRAARPPAGHRAGAGRV